MRHFPNSPVYAVYIVYSPQFPGRSRRLGELFGSVPEGLERVDLLYDNGAGEEPASAFPGEPREMLFPRRTHQVHFTRSGRSEPSRSRSHSAGTSSTSASPHTASEGRGSAPSLPRFNQDDNVEGHQAVAPSSVSELPHAELAERGSGTTPISS